MGLEVHAVGRAGVKCLIPPRISDARGYFTELFRADLFQSQVGDAVFVQDNESFSSRAGTVRGLHFQIAPRPQGKLVRCVAGSLFDVAVDIRAGSPTFGEWVCETLTPENGKQLWLPPGFAHGFCTLAPNTVISYKVTHYFAPELDKGVAWDDPEIGIRWPELADPGLLSDKDRQQPRLCDLPAYFTGEL